MTANKTSAKKIISMLTALNIALCCILSNAPTVNASADNIVGYWVSYLDSTVCNSGSYSSVKLYKLEITSVENNMVSGVFIRNSTHFRDHGNKHTFKNVPIINNKFTLKVTDIWTVPLSDENSSPLSESEYTYIITIYDNTPDVLNTQCCYDENTLSRCSYEDYRSVKENQKNESYKDYMNIDCGGAANQVSYEAFYGVWCGASKNEDDLKGIAANLVDLGYDGRIYVTTDRSGLNSERWYVVTAGTRSSAEEADRVCTRIQQAGYTDAYVKYTGEPVHQNRNINSVLTSVIS